MGLFWILIASSAVLAIAVVVRLDRLVGFGVDFEGTLYGPSTRILDGLSPYPQLEAVTRFSFPAVYPPPGMLVTVPVGLLPFTVAASLWAAVLLSVFSVGLRACGVRDVRVFAVALLTLPSASALAAGNISMLIAGLAAIAWAFRDRRGGVAALACSLALKPVLWPLVAWLIATNRRSQAVLASAAALSTVFVAWAVIGFDGLGDYPALLDRDASVQVMNGLFSVHLLVAAGASVHSAEIAGIALGAGLVLMAWRYGDDLDVFTACIVTALLASPIVFVHYLLLLLVPLAARRPTLSWPWMALFALWPIWDAYTSAATRPTWAVLITIGVCAILVTGASSWGLAADRLTVRRAVPAGV